MAQNASVAVSDFCDRRVSRSSTILAHEREQSTRRLMIVYDAQNNRTEMLGTVPFDVCT